MRRSPLERGYALLTVLGLLVLLSVVAARLDARVDGFRSQQGAWQRWSQGQLLLHEARDQVLFAMGTRQISEYGFGAGPQALRVDGRVYRLPSGVLVSVQDARGLISVAALNPQLLHNFLVQQGVADAAAAPLIDKLADYGDLDDLRRINGAEKQDYRALGLAPPRNDWPLSPYELRLVAGWAALPRIWQHAGDFFSARRDAEINPNTAPREVLMALPGATPAGVQALLTQRNVLTLQSSEQVAALSGIVLGTEQEVFYPGLFYRLRLWLPDDGPGALEYNLMFTPSAPRLPWQILESRIVDRPVLPPGQSVDALTPFPLAPVAAGPLADSAQQDAPAPVSP